MFGLLAFFDIFAQYWPNICLLQPIFGPMTEIFWSIVFKYTIFDTPWPTNFSSFALCWHFCSRLSKYLPFTVNIWSHDSNIWVHRRQIYNIWHPLTKSFPKIYTLWGQNGQFCYLCLTSAVQFPTSHSRFWVKIAWPKSERAQPKLAINFYWDKQIPSSLGELWATKKIPETGCFDPSILFL